MTCDEVFYRQYLSGDDAGLEALMEKYGDPLTLYIDGYLHDVHEAPKSRRYGTAASRRISIRPRATRRCAARAGGSPCSASTR